MKPNLATSLALSAVLCTAAASAFAYKGEALARHAKITIAQARTIALKAHPGVIAEEELEKEGGGSGLRFSFDIKAGKVVQEVGVDAKDGKVLENAPERNEAK